MTLTELIAQVGLDTGDPNHITFSQVVKRTAINAAASFVGGLVDRFSRSTLYGRGSTTFTTTTALAYSLAAATDFKRNYRTFRTDTEQDTVEISEAEKYSGGTQDDTGRWKIYFTRNPDTGVWSVNFPLQVPSGMAFAVIYQRASLQLETDGTDDAETYTDIDDDFHELIGLRAAKRLLGPDGANIGTITQDYNEAIQSLIDQVGVSSSPGQIIDEVSGIW